MDAAQSPSHDDPTLREARDRYFADNGFGADGGYSKRWEKLKLGPLTFYIPNTDGRVRALKAHDLHHVLTGYRTDWIGEFEISAWELGSGCADKTFAWLINMSGLVAGLLSSPRRVFRAFVRGRRSGNFYPMEIDEALLRRRVGEMRRELRLPEAPAAGPADVAALLGILLLAIPVGLLWLVAIPLMLPFAAATAHLHRRDVALS